MIRPENQARCPRCSRPGIMLFTSVACDACDRVDELKRSRPVKDGLRWPYIAETVVKVQPMKPDRKLLSERYFMLPGERIMLKGNGVVHHKLAEHFDLVGTPKDLGMTQVRHEGTTYIYREVRKLMVPDCFVKVDEHVFVDPNGYYPPR